MATEEENKCTGLTGSVTWADRCIEGGARDADFVVTGERRYNPIKLLAGIIKESQFYAL